MVLIRVLLVAAPDALPAVADPTVVTGDAADPFNGACLQTNKTTISNSTAKVAVTVDPITAPLDTAAFRFVDCCRRMSSSAEDDGDDDDDGSVGSMGTVVDAMVLVTGDGVVVGAGAGAAVVTKVLDVCMPVVVKLGVGLEVVVGVRVAEVANVGRMVSDDVPVKVAYDVRVAAAVAVCMAVAVVVVDGLVVPEDVSVDAAEVVCELVMGVVELPTAVLGAVPAVVVLLKVEVVLETDVVVLLKVDVVDGTLAVVRVSMPVVVEMVVLVSVAVVPVAVVMVT